MYLTITKMSVAMSNTLIPALIVTRSLIPHDTSPNSRFTTVRVKRQRGGGGNCGRFLNCGRYLHEATRHTLDPLSPSGQLHARAHGHPCRFEGLGLESDVAMQVGECDLVSLFHGIIDGRDEGEAVSVGR